MITPVVSIILPTYKDAPFLGHAIASVQAQDFSDWELLIIDDGLTEPARRALDVLISGDTRISVLRNESNLGIQRSLNRGLDAAGGEYIARIDDDDRWIDMHKLSKQIAYFAAHPDCVLVGTNATIVDADGAMLGTYSLPERDQDIRQRMLSKNCFLHPSVMMRAAAVRKAGRYPEEEDTKHVEDYALWLALGAIGTFANIADRSVMLTVHPDSLTAQNRILQAKRMRALASKYKKIYPRYALGYILLSVRLLLFRILSVMPIPKPLLYLFQKLYKAL